MPESPDPRPVPRLLLCPAIGEWLADAARSGYPREVCGLLVGSRSGAATRVERAEAATNLEEERAADRYRLDPRAFLAIDRAARRDGLDVVGVWHTHPDHPAEPSSTDLQAAWPDYTYLIISVAGDETVHLRAWELVDGRFVERPIVSQHAADRAAAGRNESANTHP
ncbi:MAG TPA: M67 family metallopeptidase [Acidobacteriota bacterium]|jgi:proteasome lid subunit RPN8/RPN11